MQRKLLPAFSSRKTRIPLQQPDVLYISDPNRVFYRTTERSQVQRYSWHLSRFPPIPGCLYQDHSTADHIKVLRLLLNIPESGTSVGFSIFLICSMDWRSGESPPCMHRILSSISAATGRQLKQSMNVFQSLILYRLLPKLKNFFTFVIKSVNSVDRGTLMVSSQQEKVPRVLYLVCQKKTDCLEWIFPSIYVITQKEVVTVWGKFTVVEKSQQIWVLTVNVAWNYHDKYRIFSKVLRVRVKSAVAKIFTCSSCIMLLFILQEGLPAWGPSRFLLKVIYRSHCQH